MTKFFKILMFFMMIFGSILVISSFNWMSMWIGLEINLLSIIPLFKSKNNKFPTEAAMKYFMVQAFASTGVVYCIMSSSNYNIFMEPEIPTSFKIILNCSLLIKMGAAPFHFWVPEIAEGLKWNTLMILLTWQKLAPMLMLSQNIHLPSFLSCVIFSSAIISGMQGLNQVSLRKILAYSSINHTSWMIAALLHSTEAWLFYYLVYLIITTNIILMFQKFKIYKIKQLPLILNTNKNVKFIFFMNFLSLGGLPPFLGFYPKWLAIYMLINSQYFFLMSVLIVMTLLTLYFYLRVTFTAFSIVTEESLISFFNNLNYMSILMNTISILGLFLMMYSYSLI